MFPRWAIMFNAKKHPARKQTVHYFQNRAEVRAWKRAHKGKLRWAVLHRVHVDTGDIIVP